MERSVGEMHALPKTKEKNDRQVLFSAGGGRQSLQYTGSEALALSSSTVMMA